MAPTSLAPDNGSSSRSQSRQRAKADMAEHRSMWNRLSFQKFGHWLKRDDDVPHSDKTVKSDDDDSHKLRARPHSSGGILHRRASKKTIPGLTRPLGFKRMNSEKKDKLLEAPPAADQKRANSMDVDRKAVNITKRPLSTPLSLPSMSAPDIMSLHENENQNSGERTIGGGPDSNIPAGARQVDYKLDPEPPVNYASDYQPVAAPVGELGPHELGPPPPSPPPADSYYDHKSQCSVSDIDDARIQQELEARWILNLSMHFRDQSDREKFFVTFAEKPNMWRRVTVSIDYRNVKLEPESLEADLKDLSYQRDKSARIYESIRDSLDAIQFYDTVTNLKLQTEDGRLHVHVTEDVNEAIPYPPISAIDHLDCDRFTEKSICFDSHISGFVYKVAVNNRIYIKKEIPGPDAVEEFLYEINALNSVRDSRSVIRFEGVIVDEANQLIKGLLISYAEQGALVDIIYDDKHTEKLQWQRRERWARQIVEGLSEIHEAGFVQGDFTLSNIVIDHDFNAKIIDINRRGCPVGWEPPELAKLIESGQRISIYIGVKSDLYQLGMVLWALAEQQDEPERQDRPLTKTLERPSEIPEYFKEIIRSCLSDRPRDRLSAKSLLAMFPVEYNDQGLNPSMPSKDTVSGHRSDKEYIDPALAVDHEDISQHRRHSRSRSSFEQVNVPSTDYLPSSDSYVLPNIESDRGRFPAEPRGSSRDRQSDDSPYPGRRSVLSFDDSEMENELASWPASRDTRWEQVYVDGDTKLVQRGGAETGVHDYSAPEIKDICLTPAELDSSFMGGKTSEDISLGFSARAELQPMQPAQPVKPAQHQPKQGKNHEHDSKQSTVPQALSKDSNQQESEPHTRNAQPQEQKTQQPEPKDLNPFDGFERGYSYESSTPSSRAPSRPGTGFSMFDRPGGIGRVGTGLSIATSFHSPVHQGFGASRPERQFYENNSVGPSLDKSISAKQDPIKEGEKVKGKALDTKEDKKIKDGVKDQGSKVKKDSGLSSALALPQTPGKDPELPSAPALPQIPGKDPAKSKSDSTPNMSNTPSKKSKLEEESSTAVVRSPSNIPIPPMPVFDFTVSSPEGLRAQSTARNVNTNTNAAANTAASINTHTRTNKTTNSTNSNAHTNTNPYHSTTSPFEPISPRYDHAYFARLRASYAQSDDLSDYLACEID